MFTGRRPRAFQFKCCVGTVILGQAWIRRKIEIRAADERGQTQICVNLRSSAAEVLNGFGFDDAVRHVGRDHAD